MADMTHILIVEDEQKIAHLIRDYLQKEGFETTCFFTGEGVLEFVHSRKPHLILLDLMLPGSDGLSLCRDIRKDSQVPIIMLTAKIDEIDRLLGLEMGADDYICKPFSPREVVARVKAVLRRTTQMKKSPQGMQISIGTIVMDKEAREVSVSGNNINLTPSEYSLLEVVMESPGRVFSRSELIDRVQGYQFDGYDRTVDSHVKNLRKKLAEAGEGKEIISTIYGVGYKLNITEK